MYCYFLKLIILQQSKRHEERVGLETQIKMSYGFGKVKLGNNAHPIDYQTYNDYKIV